MAVLLNLTLPCRVFSHALLTIVSKSISEVSPMAAIRRALETGDRAALAQLMDRNFDTRRQLFGDEVLGKVNLHMIACARSVGGMACSRALSRYIPCELSLHALETCPSGCYFNRGGQEHVDWAQRGHARYLAS